MSSDLNWMIIRNNNSFLVKRRNINKPFSKEPNNLKGVHSYRFNGLVRRRTIGIEPAADNKGVVLVYKKKNRNKKPRRSLNKITLKHNPRKTLSSIRNFCTRNNYRKDLRMLAMRRASAILKSQKPVHAKKAKSGTRTKKAD